MDNIVLIGQYRVGHGFNKSQQLLLEAGWRRYARRPKYPSSKNKRDSAETVKMIMEPVMTFSKKRNVMGSTFSKERNTRDKCGP